MKTTSRTPWRLLCGLTLLLVVSATPALEARPNPGGGGGGGNGGRGGTRSVDRPDRDSAATPALDRESPTPDRTVPAAPLTPPQPRSQPAARTVPTPSQPLAKEERPGANATRETAPTLEAHKPNGENLSAAQQENLVTLKSDLLAIQEGSNVTEQQKQDLADSLMAIADGAQRPSEQSVNQLANDLGGALEDGNLSTKEKVTLANDVAAVMNSANIPQSEVETAIASAEAILTASGVDQSDVRKIVADLEAIAAEAKKNASAAAAP